MYYFDNKYLQQYIDQGTELWVYDGYQWREVAEKEDLIDPVEGYGYDVNGRGYKFQYKQIEQIKVDGRIFTMDQLQTQMSGKSSDTGEKPASKGPKEPGPSDEEPAPEKKSEKEPDLSHFSPIYDIGRNLIAEWRKQYVVKN